VNAERNDRGRANVIGQQNIRHVPNPKWEIKQLAADKSEEVATLNKQTHSPAEADVKEQCWKQRIQQKEVVFFAPKDQRGQKGIVLFRIVLTARNSKVQALVHQHQLARSLATPHSRCPRS